MRPDVIWFGEALDERMMTELTHLAKTCDVCILVGTSGVVYPAAALPEVARHSGARLIEINLHETMLSPLCDVIIREKAGEALSLIESKL